MKKIIIITLLSVAISFTAHSQCPKEGRTKKGKPPKIEMQKLNIGTRKISGD